jgi:aerobic C4-dicarboxylate transport protein
VVISRWEGELDVTQLKAAMAHPIAFGEELEEEPV